MNSEWFLIHLNVDNVSSFVSCCSPKRLISQVKTATDQFMYINTTWQPKIHLKKATSQNSGIMKNSCTTFTKATEKAIISYNIYITVPGLFRLPKHLISLTNRPNSYQSWFFTDNCTLYSACHTQIRTLEHAFQRNIRLCHLFLQMQTWL